MSELCDSPQEQARYKLLKGLITPVMKEGFQQWRMEDIARRMDVSRATMYKHFSSKAEVIEGIVRIFVDYIEKLDCGTLGEEEASYAAWFQLAFEQSVSLVGKLSEVFLRELQSAYPEQYELLKAAMSKREERMLHFYKEGKARGIFNPVNEQFILLQDELLLREIVSVKYLLTHHVPVREVLEDYYRFKKIQLFRPDKAAAVDDTGMADVFDRLAEKFNKLL